MWLVHLALVAAALYVAVISGMYVAQTWLLFPTTLVQAGHGLAPPRLAPSALWASRQLAPSPSIAALSGFSAGLCQRWSHRPQDQPKIEIPIGYRPDPAGSFLGDFRTPAGTRNPSRKQTFALRPLCAYSVEKLGSPAAGCELRQTSQIRPERNQ
jgi:hypothetical protein